MTSGRDESTIGPGPTRGMPGAVDFPISPEGEGPASPWAEAPARPALEPHDVHLWRVDCSDAAANEQPLDACLVLLSADEIERVRRFRSEAHGTHFARRRAALRRILARYLACDPGELVFRTSPHRKPELDPPRAWVLQGGRLRFNLSHSEDLALIGITLEHDVGVDIEHVRTLPDMDALADSVFSPIEQASYRALPPPERQAGFFNGWTRKEAWLKARGEGLIGDLAGFDVTLTPGVPPRLLRVAGETDEPRAWTLAACEPGASCVGAAAVRDSEPLWSTLRAEWGEGA